MSLKDIEKQTQKVYENHAREYDKGRDRSLFEKSYLDKLLELIPNNAEILDLGCGAGEPIAKYLINKGYIVTGADYSQAMLELAKKRFPHQSWIFCDMREFNLEESYDAIISWGAFFHLTPTEQRASLPKICSSLKESGVILVTVGHEEGEVTGTVDGESVYHSSLSKEGYIQILNNSGVEIVEFNLQDKNCQGFSVFLGKKK